MAKKSKEEGTASKKAEAKGAKKKKELPMKSGDDKDSTKTTPARGDSNVVRKGQDYLGRWTKEEHDRFLKGLEEHGREWKKVAGVVGTRTVMQVRTHAQKYFTLKEEGQEMTNFAVDKPLTRTETEQAKAEKELAAEAAIKSGEKPKTSSPKKKKKSSTTAATPAQPKSPAVLNTPVNGTPPVLPNAMNAQQLLAHQQLMEQHRMIALQRQNVAFQSQQLQMQQQAAAIAAGRPGVGSPPGPPPPASIAALKDADVVVLPDAPLVGPDVPFMDRASNQEFKAILLSNVAFWHALPSTAQWAWVQRLYQFLKHVRGLNMVTMINGIAHEYHQGPWYISQQLRHDVTKAYVLETQGKTVTASEKWEGSIIALVQGSWQTLEDTQVAGLCQHGGAHWIIRLPPGVTATAKYAPSTEATAAATPAEEKPKATPKKKATASKKEKSKPAEKEKTKTPTKKSESEAKPKESKAKKEVSDDVKKGKEAETKNVKKGKEPETKKKAKKVERRASKTAATRRGSTGSKRSVDSSQNKSRRSKRQRM